MIDAIEKDVTDAPALRVAKDYLALLIGLSATLGHVERSFTASNRPDFSVLSTWFNDERDAAKDRVKDLEAAAAAVSPSHGPAPSPSAASASPGPGRDFGAIFEDMLVELEKDEYDSSDEDLRAANEQVTLLAGLEATLDRLVKTAGGPQGDMRQLRTGLAGMRAEMEAEAKSLAPAGGGGGVASVGDLVEIRKLTQAIHAAEAAVAAAKVAYQPVKPLGGTNKAKKRVHAQWKAANKTLVEARQALADYKDSAGLPADTAAPTPEEPPALSET
jgi:hypothetical protein